MLVWKLLDLHMHQLGTCKRILQLSNCYQTVVLDGAQSCTLPVIYSVPQDSVLIEPFTSSIYIDKVSSSVTNGSRFAMLLYAAGYLMHARGMHPRAQLIQLEPEGKRCISIPLA